MDENQTFKVINEDPLQSPVANTENPLNTGNGTPSETPQASEKKAEEPHEINIESLVNESKKDDGTFTMGGQTNTTQNKPSFLKGHALPIFIVLGLTILGGVGFLAYTMIFTDSEPTVDEPEKTEVNTEVKVDDTSLDIKIDKTKDNPFTKSAEGNLDKALIEVLDSPAAVTEIPSEEPKMEDEQPPSLSTKIPRH